MSLSFQPARDNSVFIHHHFTPSPERDETWRPRPIEFRRPILAVPLDETMPSTTKLLEPDSQQFVPTVEVFPIKMTYRVVGDLNAGEQKGFLLVSKASLVVDVIPAVRKAVAPDKSSLCVRIWSKRETLRRNGGGATKKGDGYELVHIDRLDGNVLDEEDDEEPEASIMTMGEWVSQHCSSTDKPESIDILVEIRASPSAQWSREALEFENRLEVRFSCNRNLQARTSRLFYAHSSIFIAGR